MAKKSSVEEEIPEGAHVEDVEFSSHLQASFNRYGIAANKRMIPQIADGLKVSQRRALWAMYWLLGTDLNKRMKSSRVVGEIMGKYHPHGDMAIYDTMANLSLAVEDSNFHIHTPYIKGHGGWGSQDRKPSAPRYTESKINNYALYMLGILKSLSDKPEFKENSVDLVPTYDGAHEEPTSLPALFPAFIINPYRGVGTGLKGNNPGHSFDEVMNLAHHMVDAPNPRVDTIRKFIMGPDCPTDAIIFDTDDGGIDRYLTTGEGSFIMRSQMEVEEYKEGRKKGTYVIITGLPWHEKASPGKAIAGIESMIEAELIQPEITISDESASGRTRIILDIKDNDPDDVIQRLLYNGQRSKLQMKVDVVLYGLDDKKKPHIVSVVEGINLWLKHRRQAITRRTRFRLKAARDRQHILQGLVKAIPLAEEIIKLLRASNSRAEASVKVQEKWGFSEVQTEAILRLTIVQIAKLGVENDYDAQLKALEGSIVELESIIQDESSLNSQLKKEIRIVQKEISIERRCEVDLEHDWRIDAPETPAVEYIPEEGIFVRTSGNWVRWAERRNINMRVGNDYVTEVLDVNDLFTLECFTNFGKHFRLDMAELPRKMTLVDTLLGQNMDMGERVVWCGTLDYWEPEDAPDLVMFTNGGTIKRLKHEDILKRRLNRSYPAFKLDEDEEIVQAFPIEEGEDILVVTDTGMISRIDGERINAKGGGAGGNPGFKFTYEDDEIVYAGPVTDDSTIAYWLDDNRIGFAFGDDLTAKGRNTRGVSLSKGDVLVRGAISDYGDTICWFSNEDEQEHRINFIEKGTKTGIGGRQSGLKVTADGIRTASDDNKTRCAVWIESAEGDDEEEIADEE